MVILLVIALALGVLYTVGGLPAVIIVGGVAACWGLSLVVWPDKTCSSCQGGGSRRGPFTWVRTCGECGGTGRIPRIGGRE